MTSTPRPEGVNCFDLVHEAAEFRHSMGQGLDDVQWHDVVTQAIDNFTQQHGEFLRRQLLVAVNGEAGGGIREQASRNSTSWQAQDTGQAAVSDAGSRSGQPNSLLVGSASPRSAPRSYLDAPRSQANASHDSVTDTRPDIHAAPSPASPSAGTAQSVPDLEPTAGDTAMGMSVVSPTAFSEALPAPTSDIQVWAERTNEAGEALMQRLLRSRLGQLRPGTPDHARFQAALAAYDPGQLSAGAFLPHRPAGPPYPVDYGKIGIEFETDWFLVSDADLKHGHNLATDSNLTLTVERNSLEHRPFLEIVSSPITFQDEPSGVSEERLWESLETVLRVLKPGRSIRQLFGPNNGFRALEHADAMLSTEGLGVDALSADARPRLLSAQWTVGVHASELLEWILKDTKPLSVHSLPRAHMDAETGAAFAKEIAARYYSATHHVPIGHPAVAWETIDDPEYRSLAGLLLLVFTQAITAVHRAADVKSGQRAGRWFKSYAFVASRHDPAKLAQALSAETRQFLDTHTDSVLDVFREHVLRVTAPASQQDPLLAGFAYEGMTVGDYLRSFLRIRNPVNVPQKVMRIMTVFPDFDGEKILVEVRDTDDFSALSEARRFYEGFKGLMHARHEAAARRKALPAAHHAQQRLLQEALAADDLVQRTDRLRRAAQELDTAFHRDVYDYPAFDASVFSALVRQVSAPHRPSPLTDAADDLDRVLTALHKWQTDLTEFVHRFLRNVPGAVITWEATSTAWRQALRDTRALRRALSGTSQDLPSTPDVLGDWKRHSALPGLTSRAWHVQHRFRRTARLFGNAGPVKVPTAPSHLSRPRHQRVPPGTALLIWMRHARPTGRPTQHPKRGQNCLRKSVVSGRNSPNSPHSPSRRHPTPSTNSTPMRYGSRKSRTRPRHTRGMRTAPVPYRRNRPPRTRRPRTRETTVAPTS